MKQTSTLGKRISAHRKRLGLTQDQLAERVGVSAQAVSKWENDLSCPDISILPKLASIFGTTTDELLGAEPQTAQAGPAPVFRAEVVEEEPCRTTGWSWRSELLSGALFALYMITLGTLLLLSKLLHWQVGFWSLAWPPVLIFLGIHCLRERFSVFGLGMSAAGVYFLLCNIGVLKIPAWSIFLPVVLMLWGLGLLVDCFTKKRRRRRTHTVVGDGKGSAQVSTADGIVRAEVAFTTDSGRVAGPMREGKIEVAFGSFTLDLTDCTKLLPGCCLKAEVAFGSAVLLCPRRFRVEPRTDKTFASLEISGAPDDDPQGVLSLDGECTFGSIEIRYI